MSRDLPPIPFREIADRAAMYVVELCQRWLPDGRQCGREWVARNPMRNDTNPGSFRVVTVGAKRGFWKDFALDGVQGKDMVSLARYLGGADCTMVDAADAVAAITGHPWRKA